MAHDSRLDPILRAVEPRVRLVPERHLREILQYLDDDGRTLAQNPDLPVWIARQDLEDAAVLPDRTMEGAEPELLLISEPRDRMLEKKPMAELLLAYWRVLVQAAIAREIDSKVAAGALTAEQCTEKLGCWGPHVEREIRYVLFAEHRIVDPGVGAIEVYRAFAAAYVDFATFDRRKIEAYFPSMPSKAVSLGWLADDLDIPALVTASRPVGAADLPVEIPPDELWIAPDPEVAAPGDVSKAAIGLDARAKEAEAVGNNVRAAILFAQAAAMNSSSESDARLNAQRTLEKVVAALGDMFEWDGEVRGEWNQALLPLLGPATAGVWPRAARCLYELQRIPRDLAREVYAVDLPEFIRTLGRSPIKRPLPRARKVLILMHLRKAHAQMLRVGLGHHSELRLDGLFHHQMHAIEADVRAEFAPIVEESLARAGLRPKAKVEFVGRDKLVAELLDRICERGYLRFGDVRDAVARNQLKMPDLSGIGEFLSGDSLLRTDSELARELDGVYRRGEVYLRCIQRFSAFFFGTKIGRLITVFLALPFGGAFIGLMFADHIRHKGGELIASMSRPAPKPIPPPAADPEAQAALPKGEFIQAHQVEWDSGADEIVVYPPEVVTSDEVEVNDVGELIVNEHSPAKVLLADILKPIAPFAGGKPVTQVEEGSALIEWPTIVGTGIFILLMVHLPPFRQFVFKLLGILWYSLRAILWDIPIRSWRSPLVRRVRNSKVVRFLFRHFWSPTLITLLAFAALFFVGVRPRTIAKWGWLGWGSLTVLYNTRWGWVIQDRIVESISDWWRIVSANLIPGVIRTFIDWFGMLGNWIERQLYAVDEWLQYRRGDSHTSLVFKAIVGLLWFPLAYGFRFVFYLLVEPQINPVKHFPVVTVSHKVILPMIPQIAGATGLSEWTVTALVAGIPGIFGFIAWELMANWRLYKTNLPPHLQPATIGSHGESMRGLLRPGFHSGTVPKLFRKLRHADHANDSQFLHQFEHLEEAVRRFAEREFLALIQRCPEWGRLDACVAEIHFGAQRAAIEFEAAGLGRDRFALAFENVQGRIDATIARAGWVDRLTDQQRSAFVAALRGFLDLAAVETVAGRTRQEGVAPLGKGFEDLARIATRHDWERCWNRPEVGE